MVPETGIDYCRAWQVLALAALALTWRIVELGGLR